MATKGVGSHRSSKGTGGHGGLRFMIETMDRTRRNPGPGVPKAISAKYLVIVAAILLYPGLALSQDHGRPIIAVPGFLGSVLSENEDVVWGTPSSLLPRNLRRLDLLPDSEMPVHLRPTDILRTVPLVFGLMHVGVYGSLIDFLTGEDIGYEEGRDLHVFYYDWRRTNFASSRLLRDFIEETVGNQPYDLIAHSMGGIVVRLMLAGDQGFGACEWLARSNSLLADLSDDDLTALCDAMYGPDGDHRHGPDKDVVSPHDVASNLHTYVEIAVPHFGSNDVVANYRDAEWGRLVQMMGGSGKLRGVLNSFASIVELLPSYPNCCALGRDGRYDNRPVPDSDVFSFETWSELILDIDEKQCTDRSCVLRRALLAASLDSRAEIHRVIEQKVPDTVKRLLAFAGTDVANTRLVNYFDAQASDDPISFQVTDNGDGTVPLVSSSAPEPDRTVYVPRANHLSLLDHESLRTQLEFAILRPDEPRTIQVTDHPLTFAGEEVNSTSVIVRPRISLAGDVIWTDVSILVGSGVDQAALSLQNVSVRVTRADTGEVAVHDSLSLDAASSPASGKLRYTGAFRAPESPHVYEVEAMVTGDTGSETIGKAVLSVLKTAE